MDSLFGKLGLFDFFSMLLPGLIIEAVAVLLFPGIADVFAQFESIQLFLYLLGGYLTGLVLHEIIGIIPEKLHISLVQKAHRLSEDGVIFTNINDLNLLQGVKASIIHEVDESENEKENTDRYVVSVCTNDLQAKGKADKAERLQVMSELSESLSVGFLLLGVVKLLGILHSVLCNGQPIETMRCGLIACVALLFLYFLFLERAQRMHKYYLRCLVRTYAVVNNIMPLREENGQDENTE